MKVFPILFGSDVNEEKMLDFSRTKWTVFFLREQRKLISLLSSFYYCFFLVFLVSVSFDPHFTVRILSSAFFQPHFIFRIFPSVIRHPPPSGQHVTETRFAPTCVREEPNKMHSSISILEPVSNRLSQERKFRQDHEIY